MKIMRSRPIGRTIVLSHCNGQRVNRKTGEFEDFCPVLYGQLSAAAAQKYLRAKFQDDSIIIANIEQDIDYYEMSAEDFIKNAIRRSEKNKQEG